MRHEARDGGDTVKRFFASDRHLLFDPKGRSRIAQSWHNPILTMHQHRLRRIFLSLNDADPGETHLPFVRKA